MLDSFGGDKGKARAGLRGFGNELSPRGQGLLDVLIAVFPFSPTSFIQMAPSR